VQDHRRLEKPTYGRSVDTAKRRVIDRSAYWESVRNSVSAHAKLRRWSQIAAGPDRLERAAPAGRRRHGAVIILATRRHRAVGVPVGATVQATTPSTLRLGDTENTTVVSHLLADLHDRGLDASRACW
jgi:hypothetical protein